MTKTAAQIQAEQQAKIEAEKREAERREAERREAERREAERKRIEHNNRINASINSLESKIQQAYKSLEKLYPNRARAESLKTRLAGSLSRLTSDIMQNVVVRGKFRGDIADKLKARLPKKTNGMKAIDGRMGNLLDHAAKQGSVLERYIADLRAQQAALRAQLQ